MRNSDRFVESLLRPGMRVLNVCVQEQDGTMEKQEGGMYSGIICKGKGVGRTVLHDYDSLDEIHEQFDLITFFHVIEHVEVEEGVALLGRLHQLLVAGGSMLISTPNIYNPALHAVHTVAYTYEELGGLLLSQGFNVQEMYRIYDASPLQYVACVPLLYPVHRILNADFAQSIVVLVQKEERI